MILGGQHALHHVLVGAVRGHGQKRRAKDGRPDCVFAFEDSFDVLPEAHSRDDAAVEEREVARCHQRLLRARPAAGDVAEQRVNREPECAEHDRGLDDIGPDDGLDPAQRGVDRSDRGEEGECADVDPDLLERLQLGAGRHFKSEHEHDRGDVEPRAAGQRARDEENGRRRVLRLRPETHEQELIDRDDAVIVVRLDEKKRDDDAGEDRADGELRVREIAQRVAFARRAEKSRGADLRGEDRSQHSPPRDAAVACREAFHRGVAAAFVEADAR